MRLLIIDDDSELCQLVADYLRPMGFLVEMEHEGIKGAARAASEVWSAILLDVMMPGCDGFEVLRRIREKSRVPVIMLTGRGEEVDRIVGLELGADDYLPKTFSSRELLARLRAVLRRTGWIAESAPQAPIKELVIGELRINPETHDVILGDQPMQLTPAEFGLLLSLAKAHGRHQRPPLQLSLPMALPWVLLRHGPTRSTCFATIELAKAPLHAGQHS